MPVFLNEDTNFTEVQVTGYQTGYIHALLEHILKIPSSEQDDLPASGFFQQGHPYFLRGLTPFVATELHRHGIEVQWNAVPRTLRSYAPCSVDFNRHLQGWVVDEMLKHRYGVIDIATRFGKSFVYLQWYFRAGRPRTIIFVPTADIAKQIRDDFRTVTGEPVGMVASTVQKEFDWQNLTVCIRNSLFEGNMLRTDVLPYLEATEARITDECHKTANQLITVFMAMPNCIYAWGSSATPLVKNDWKDWSLIGWHGPTRIEVTAQVAAHYGIIAPVNAVWVPFRHQGPVLSGEFDEIYKAGVVQNFERNQLIAKIARTLNNCGKQGLIFVNYSEQGQRVANDIPGSMVVASKLLTQKEADQIKVQFNQGEVQTVCCTKKWREGVTFKCDFAINAEAMKADHVTVQKLGRGLIPKADGRPFLWIDISDYGLKMLRNHADRRRECLYDEGWGQITVNTAEELATLVRSNQI